jgi:hypothetical protein
VVGRPLSLTVATLVKGEYSVLLVHR